MSYEQFCNNVMDFSFLCLHMYILNFVKSHAYTLMQSKSDEIRRTKKKVVCSLN